jgi:hypothetical protein
MLITILIIMEIYVYVCVRMHVYICIYTYIHTHIQYILVTIYSNTSCSDDCTFSWFVITKCSQADQLCIYRNVHIKQHSAQSTRHDYGSFPDVKQYYYIICTNVAYFSYIVCRNSVGIL